MKNNEETFNENIFDYNNQDNDILDEDFFKDKNYLEDDIYKNSERLKIEKIEQLENISNSYKKAAILFGITSGLWGLCALLNSTRIVTTDDPSFLLYVIVCLNSITSGLNLKLSIDNYNKKKEIDNNIEKEKKLI